MLRLPLRLRAPSGRRAISRAPLRRPFSLSRPLAAHRSLTESDVEHFASFLPKSSILSTLAPFTATSDDLAPFNHDWMGKYTGESKCVLKPSSAEEVSRILKWCNEHDIAVVPQGGNTGLVGASLQVPES